MSFPRVGRRKLRRQLEATHKNVTYNNAGGQMMRCDRKPLAWLQDLIKKVTHSPVVNDPRAL